MDLPISLSISKHRKASPLQELRHRGTQALPGWGALQWQCGGRDHALDIRRRTTHSNEPNDPIDSSPILHVMSKYSHDPSTSLIV